MRLAKPRSSGPCKALSIRPRETSQARQGVNIHGRQARIGSRASGATDARLALPATRLTSELGHTYLTSASRCQTSPAPSGAIMAVRRLAFLMRGRMKRDQVTSLADHRRHVAENRLETAIKKFVAMGGTFEEARRIVELAFSAESPEALEAAIRQMHGEG
jgi:hypothetical protein